MYAILIKLSTQSFQDDMYAFNCIKMFWWYLNKNALSAIKYGLETVISVALCFSIFCNYTKIFKKSINKCTVLFCLHKIKCPKECFSKLLICIFHRSWPLNPQMNGPFKSWFLLLHSFIYIIIYIYIYDRFLSYYNSSIYEPISKLLSMCTGHIKILTNFVSWFHPPSYLKMAVMFFSFFNIKKTYNWLKCLPWYKYSGVVISSLSYKKLMFCSVWFADVLKLCDVYHATALVFINFGTTK